MKSLTKIKVNVIQAIKTFFWNVRNVWYIVKRNVINFVVKVKKIVFKGKPSTQEMADFKYQVACLEEEKVMIRKNVREIEAQQRIIINAKNVIKKEKQQIEIKRLKNKISFYAKEMRKRKDQETRSFASKGIEDARQLIVIEAERIEETIKLLAKKIETAQSAINNLKNNSGLSAEKETDINNNIAELTLSIEKEKVVAQELSGKYFAKLKNAKENNSSKLEIRDIKDQINELYKKKYGQLNNKKTIELIGSEVYVTRKTLKVRTIKATKNTAHAMLYLAPALILLGIFTFYPIINSMILVVYDGYQRNGMTGEVIIDGFTFLGNFHKVVSTPGFILPYANGTNSALVNTALISIISVPASILIALLIAVALNSIKPLKSFFQTIFFLPYVTNTMAIGLVFNYMFSGTGLVNTMLGWFNINPNIWVDKGASYGSAMFVLILYSIWDSLAFKIMVFLAAIQGIDKQYYQAAQIDGTSKIRTFTKITVPMISPMVFYILVTSIIGAFKTYTSVIALFGTTGAPAGAIYNLRTIVFFVYGYIDSRQLHLASAASLILFAMILVLTFIQMQVSKRRVHY